ncbi:MAG TPA: RNA polymerase sigma factor [Ktedonobacterales bacterium]|nr:RNA polymerase sigma factor [Ktedonobacterales bacterium]
MGLAGCVTGSLIERRLEVEIPGRGGMRVGWVGWVRWMSLLALLTGAAPDGRTLASASRANACDGAEEAPREHPETPGGTITHQSEDPTFDAFFRRHEQPLYGFLRRMLPTHEVAVEVAQEAFFRAWTHFTEVRAYERPEAWLYRVATNLAISHLRRRQPLAFAQVFRRAGADEEGGDGGEEDALADPLDMEGDTAARDLINRVLLRLPERQRAALLLRTVYGFSGEEIAEMLGISVANARQVLRRGRERFRQFYEEAERVGGDKE